MLSIGAVGLHCLRFSGLYFLLEAGYGASNGNGVLLARSSGVKVASAVLKGQET